MFTYSKLLIAMTLPVTLLACGDKNNNAVPPVDIKVDPYISEDALCDKPESELPVNKGTLQNVFSFKAQIPTQKTRYTQCNGEVTEYDMPVKKFSVRIDIPAPQYLRSEVNFVEVRNHRDCAISRLDASKRDVMTPVYLGGQNPLFQMPFNMSHLSKRGFLRLVVEDGRFKNGFDKMNVVNGKNVLEVIYYGQCTAYKDRLNKKLGAATTCLQAKELGRKMVTVNIAIDRPYHAGVREVIEDRCAENYRR